MVGTPTGTVHDALPLGLLAPDVVGATLALLIHRSPAAAVENEALSKPSVVAQTPDETIAVSLGEVAAAQANGNLMRDEAEDTLGD